jgi:hypothetical protein
MIAVGVSGNTQASVERQMSKKGKMKIIVVKAAKAMTQVSINLRKVSRRFRELPR